MNDSSARNRDQPLLVFCVCLFLAAITFFVFGQTAHFDFVNFDDDIYVYENPIVSRGLTLDGIAAAFTQTTADNWQPLTILSHTLDCQIYGLKPGAHHLTNVLLHCAAAILLFLVLRETTGALWPGAFVAAVFAIHPLQVESVAWIAERKNVLSAVFFMLTLGAYVRYVRGPQSPGRYAMITLFYTLGLLSKPTLVTLPFVLLLFDYWPLNRMAHPADTRRISFPVLARLIVEKIPLFALAVATCAATLLAQREGIQPIEKLSLSSRIGNALISCAIYVKQMFYTSGLAAFYPHPESTPPLSQTLPSLALLVFISAGVFFLRRKSPWLIVGWLWFLGMLVPVIGVVQVGLQARADRHVYLPQIGLSLALAWTAANQTAASCRSIRFAVGIVATLVLAGFLACARIQTTYWRDSESLWNHALDCTSRNYFAHLSLADDLHRKGRLDESILHYRKALEFRPAYPEAHNNFANALLQNGNTDEAVVHYEKALEAMPGFAAPHSNLGDIFLNRGRLDEAIDHYQKAVKARPDIAKVHNNLGEALLQKGRLDEASDHFQKALRLDSENLSIQNNVAWMLATCPKESLRNGIEAVAAAEKANRISGGNQPVILHTLAAAYAETGRFSEAIETAEHALALATAQDNFALAQVIREQLALYRTNTPFRDTNQMHNSPHP